MSGQVNGLLPAAVSITRDEYSYDTRLLWAHEFVAPKLRQFIDDIGADLEFYGDASQDFNESLDASFGECYQRPSGNLMAVAVGTTGRVRNPRICVAVTQSDLRIYLVIGVQQPLTMEWTFAYTPFTAKSSFDAGGWSVTAMVSEDSPLLIGVEGGQQQLLANSEESERVTVTVDPVNIMRTVYLGEAVYAVLPPGVRSCDVWKYVAETATGKVTATGYVDGAWSDESPNVSLTQVEATLSRVTFIGNGVVILVDEEGNSISLGEAPCSADLDPNFVGTAHLSGVETSVDVVNPEDGATYQLPGGTPDNPDNPNPDTDPTLPPLPDPVDAENMLIRVHTALAGVVSYDNDGWPSADIEDVSTEGVVDIEVSPPNNWPLSLMTGGVLTFRVGSREFTKRVEFCPNTSIVVYMGPDVVRVVGGSVAQEVFWNPDGLMSWLRGLGTSRGVAEDGVDVEFQVEESGIVSVTREGKTYQELILYQGGTVHEIPYDDVTTNASLEPWGDYGPLIRVAIIAILAVAVIAIIRE